MCVCVCVYVCVCVCVCVCVREGLSDMCTGADKSNEDNCGNLKCR